MYLCDIPLSHIVRVWLFIFSFFFFNDTATTEIYTLSLHDALPIYIERQKKDVEKLRRDEKHLIPNGFDYSAVSGLSARSEEHTSELQSPVPISYAVFCLKKKKKKNTAQNIAKQLYKNTATGSWIIVKSEHK